MGGQWKFADPCRDRPRLVVVDRSGVGADDVANMGTFEQVTPQSSQLSAGVGVTGDAEADVGSTAG